MPTRSGVLCKLLSVGAGGVVLGNVPASDTWVVKDVRVYNTTGAPVNVSIFAADATSTIFGALFIGAVAAGAVGSVSCWVAVPPSGSIQALPGAAGVHIWVSGADLPGHL